MSEIRTLPPDNEETSNQSALNELRVSVADVMTVENAEVDAVGRAIAFSGHLLPPDEISRLTRFAVTGL